MILVLSANLPCMIYDNVLMAGANVLKYGLHPLFCLLPEAMTGRVMIHSRLGSMCAL